MWKRRQKLEAEAVEAVKFLWKRGTLKKEAGSGSKKYSTASTSLVRTYAGPMGI